jgi:hypothetical protein
VNDDPDYDPLDPPRNKTFEWIVIALLVAVALGPVGFVILKIILGGFQ